MKCEFCGAIYFTDKTKIFHEFTCPENKLNKEQWEAEKQERDTRLANFLIDMVSNSDKVNKMSYSDIRKFLNKMADNLHICSVETLVLERAADIIENYEKEFLVFST